MGPDTIWILIPLSGILLAATIVYLSFKKQMLVLKLSEKSSIETGATAEIESLKHQLAELRDTTTRYDMSFDSALQRIESQVGNVEGRLSAIEQTNQQTVGR